MSNDVKITYINNTIRERNGQFHLNDEWIRIENISKRRINMFNWEVWRWKPGKQYSHIYRFPRRINNFFWTLDPDEIIVLFTGYGSNKFVEGDINHRSEFHFYCGEKAFIWNNQGDMTCLFDTKSVVSTLAVP
ncbi:lamin tail domain-containing protein [Clostridium sp. WILCCON 0269]|uniref:Lamin tail domain-containing protein n=1 Tax=Candidatus Clostridium eludens TaxID=3381663 RepID=A0ABW8SGQ5_9CLOT